MADTPGSATKIPWHLWVVGVVSLLWNAVGALDFTMTQMRNEAYLKDFTPEQIAYFTGFPLWVVLAWGIATWGSVLGSLLLLCRRSLSVQLFLASFIGMVLTTIYNFVLTDGLSVMGGSIGVLLFSSLIFVVAVLLLVYARTMRRRGVLH